MAEGILFEVADELAQRALEIWELTGDEDIFDEVTKIIGTSSQTLEEAFKTAVRVRRAEKRALEMLADRLEEVEEMEEMAAMSGTGGLDDLDDFDDFDDLKG